LIDDMYIYYSNSTKECIQEMDKTFSS